MFSFQITILLFHILRGAVPPESPHSYAPGSLYNMSYVFMKPFILDDYSSFLKLKVCEKFSFTSSNEERRLIKTSQSEKRSTICNSSGIILRHDFDTPLILLDLFSNCYLPSQVKTAMPGVQNTESTFSLKPYQSAKGLYISLIAPVVLPKVRLCMSVKYFSIMNYNWTSSFAKIDILVIIISYGCLYKD